MQGCDFCRDVQNVQLGHVTQVASGEGYGLLLRCPRCGSMYLDPADGRSELAQLDVTELAHKLATWTDWDLAAYRLGVSFGMFRTGDFATTHKWVFWTDNAVGNGLHHALLALVQAGVLERRDGADEQFRWRTTQL